MKRFNFIVQWLTIFLYVALQPAVAGLPPTRSSGQSDSLSTTFDFKAPYSQVTKYSGTGGLIETGNYQVLKNPSFEAATYSASWTASGGTLAAATSTNIFFGKSATWDASSASQTLTSDAITVPEGFKGNNCEASIYIKVPSGTATHTLSAFDGTNTLASASVINSVYFTKNTVTFPCPTSGTIALRITSVASDEPLIALDEGYLGLARNVGTQDLITEWEAWTPTGVWVSGATYTGFKRRVGTNQEIKFRISLGSAPSGTLELNLPSGCVVDTTKVTGNNARVPLGNHLIFDSDTGANIYGTVQAASTTSVSLNVILTGNASTAPISNVTASVPITFASGDTIDGYFSVPCVGWAASTVAMPDAQGWFASASITGANANITGSSSAMQETTNASLSMVQNPGSATVGIPCASGTTNSQGALTCASANESFGIDVSVPRSGSYEVCAQGAVGFNDSGSGTNFNAEITFAVVQTTAGTSTPVVEGPGRSNAKYGSNSAGGGEVIAVHYPFNSCSTFSLSAGRNTFRLMNENLVSGTGSMAMMADGDASVGAKSVTFTVKPVSQQQQAILANSVSTSRQNGRKIELATLACSSSSSKTDEDNVIATLGNISSGTCSFTVTSGLFSTTPRCFVTLQNAAVSDTKVNCSMSSATAGTVSCYGNGSNCTSFSVNLLLNAPR